MFYFAGGNLQSIKGMTSRQQLLVIPKKIKECKRLIKIFDDVVDTSLFKKEISLLKERGKNLKKQKRIAV